MLAMDQRTPLGVRYPASSLTTIASMLAPTGIGGIRTVRPEGRHAPTGLVKRSSHTTTLSPPDTSPFKLSDIFVDNLAPALL
jgi:hypothetical protein